MPAPMLASVAKRAFQRRFLLGPLVALAMLGTSGDFTGSVGPTPNGSASPTASPGQAVRQLLIDALEAEQVFYVDNLVFASTTGDELEVLKKLDPSIAWGRTVYVEVPKSEGLDSPVVVLRAPLPDGASLCFSLVTTEEDAGIWYARAAAGGACPKVRRGMRGWSPDEAAGWGAA